MDINLPMLCTMTMIVLGMGGMLGLVLSEYGKLKDANKALRSELEERKPDDPAQS